MSTLKELVPSTDRIPEYYKESAIFFFQISCSVIQKPIKRHKYKKKYFISSRFLDIAM